MDIGAFVLDAEGVRWALDLGAEGYHGIEARGMNLWSSRQDSDRWKIYRQSNAGHNTLVIDEQLQVAAAAGEFVAFSEDARFPFSVLDMSAVYEGQAGLAWRGVALLPTGEVLIQDRLKGLRPGSRVRWGMITPGETADMAGGRVELRQADRRLGLRILSPVQAEWRVLDSATPRHEWDSPNRGTRMMAFEAVAPDSGDLILGVVATPGSCQAPMASGIRLRPLEQWHPGEAVWEHIP